MPDSLSRLCFVLSLFLPAFATQNIVLSSTDPSLVYNPPLCPPSSAGVSCTSPWQASNDTVPGSTVVGTNGPIPQAGNVIPQVFLDFRASAIYLRTTASNATVNISLTAEPIDVSITKTVNTSVSLIVAVDIPETQTTTLGITFVEGDLPTAFDIEYVMLTVTNASATSSILPSASLPFATLPPTLVPSSTASSSRASVSTGTIIGSVLGAVFGVILLAIMFAMYRYRKRLAVLIRPNSRIPQRNS